MHKSKSFSVQLKKQKVEKISSTQKLVHLVINEMAILKY